MKYLNENQAIAVNHEDGPMLVLAGPGSGKTTVIVHRVKNLLEKNVTTDKKILVITFSKSATNEMQQRFQSLTDNKYSGVMFSTFHAYFYRIIRRFIDIRNYKIIYDDDKKSMILKIASSLNISIEDDEQINNIINEISFIKNECVDINDFDSEATSKSNFINIFTKYEEEKMSQYKLDFDDMLSKCYSLLLSDSNVLKLCQNQYDYILVDEFQDINRVQYNAIKLISKKHNNFFAVGDDDQSIYKFRGSNPEFLLNFKKEFNDAQIVTLNVNYRSTDSIIKLSNVIIRNNKKRFKKEITGTHKVGVNPKHINVSDVKNEARFISEKILELTEKNNIEFEEIAIIFRNNLQSRAIVSALMDRNIPFVLKDITSSIYDHYVAKDILSYLKLSIDRKENNLLLRIFNKPNRYISKVIIETNREKLKNEESLIDKMMLSNTLNEWQLRNITELSLYLKEIKKKKPYDAIKYIRKIVGYDDYISEISKKRKVSEKGLLEILDELQESAENFETIEEFLNNIELLKEKTGEMLKEPKRKGVVLTTMHSSKGLEFEAVFVTGLVEGIIPNDRAKSTDEIEEERRLFYVAVTRAKSYLFLSSFRLRYEKEAKITRFLDFLK